MRNIKSYYQHNRLFVGYLLSYALIAIIPLLAFRIFFVDRISTIEKQNAIDTAIISSQHITDSSDKVIENLLGVRLKMSTNTAFSPNYNVNNPLVSRKKVEEINKFVPMYDLINIGLIYPNDDRVYLAHSAPSIDMFVNQTYTFENRSPAEIKELLNNATNEMTIFKRDYMSFYGNQVERSTWITMPLNYGNTLFNNSTSHNPLLLFILPEKTFDDIVTTSLANSYGYALILNNDNEVLYESDFLTEHHGIITQHVADKDYNNMITLNKESYIIAGEQSNRQINCYTIIPINNYADSILKEQQKMYLLIVSLLIFAIVAVYFIMQKSYRPLRSLINDANAINGYTNTESLSAVKDTLKVLAEDNVKYSSDYMKSCEYRLIQCLINGNPTHNEDELRLLNNFKSKMYMLVIVKWENNQAMANTDEILKTQFKNENIKLMIHNSLYADSSMILVSGTTKHQLLQIAHSIHDLLCEVSWELTIGVSDVCASLESIESEYKKACISLDFRFIYGNSRIIYYEDIRRISETNIALSRKEIQSISTNLIAGNYIALENTLYTILMGIKEKALSVESAKKICFDLIYDIDEIVQNVSEQFDVDYSLAIDVLLNHKTIDMLFDALAMELFDLHLILEKSKSDKSRYLSQEIRTYIELNCCDANFSLQTVSDHLKMPLTTLSQYFKEKTNQTILEYATQVKVNKAKDKLFNSDISVNDLAEFLGYSTPSSFIRRFKQITGYTPKQYRKKVTIGKL